MARIWETAVGIAKLVEEWMAHCLDGGKTLSWCVLQKCCDQIKRIIGRFAEDLMQFRLCSGEHGLWNI